MVLIWCTKNDAGYFVLYVFAWNSTCILTYVCAHTVAQTACTHPSHMCVCICLHTCVHSLDLLLATILLSGPKCPDTWVANYSGGCAPEGTLIPPPHATALPHMLGCYGNLSTNLHPLLGKGRVKETFLAGLGLISSKGKSLSAIQVCCKHLYNRSYEHTKETPFLESMAC